MHYRSPFWLPGGNLQTIWSALGARRTVAAPSALRRERWDTPDGDFIDVDRCEGMPGGILLVLFHGLEGSSSSHYAQAFAALAQQRGMHFAVPHFRGCSGELNRAPRAYHSGDHEEVDWILRRFRAHHEGPVIAVGVSLGGNALLRWAGEVADQAANAVTAVAAVSAPLDLAAGGHAIGQGFNRQVYNRIFLRTMKAKAWAKLKQYPGLFDSRAMERARDLYEFDDIFTAPLHGFRNTADYWARASAKPYLPKIRIPALALNAMNDPFVPARSLPREGEVGEFVSLWQPAYGGHVGFADGPWPGHLHAMPEAVVDWLLAHLNGEHAGGGRLG